MTNQTPIARLRGIEKSYPGVKALDGVDFEIHAGEIHCLVGENGAGKSTLMRVLTGAAQPDAGSIEIDGAPVHLDPTTGLQHGIGIVYQELDLIPAMSVAENIFLGHEPANALGVIDRAELHGKARALLANFELSFPPETLVRNLRPAQRQLVQIAKALSHQNRILILDEPTAALSDRETAQLFKLLKRFRAGGLAMVYISHRLEEVTELANRITVFRDGRNVKSAPGNSMTQDDIVEAMVGRPLDDQFVRSEHTATDVALKVENLSRAGEFTDISFELRKGEVLALAGIVGAGRSELLETLFGLRHPDSGTVLLDGAPVSMSSPRVAIRHGLGLVPEERRESGLVLGRGVGENIVYPSIDAVSGIAHLRHGRIRRMVRKYIDDISIKTPSAQTLAGTLSGGNQQKIVIGKWLAKGIRILLLDEPTRGIDVNAKAEIYRLIDQLAASGVAVIVASSELPEVLGISDRVLVLEQGRQAAVLDTRKTTQVEIMHYAVSSGAARPTAQPEPVQ